MLWQFQNPSAANNPRTRMLVTTPVMTTAMNLSVPSSIGHVSSAAARASPTSHAESYCQAMARTSSSDSCSTAASTSGAGLIGFVRRSAMPTSLASWRTRARTGSTTSLVT
jgi:hypothetical protein